MKKSEVFERAVEILDERGWHQGDYVDDENKSVCYIGALRLAAGGYVHSEHSHLVVGTRLSEELELEAYHHSPYRSASGDGNIPVWNDAEGRTKEEVQEHMMEMAKHFRDLGE